MTDARKQAEAEFAGMLGCDALADVHPDNRAVFERIWALAQEANVGQRMLALGWELDSFEAIAEELERLSGMCRSEAFRRVAAEAQVKELAALRAGGEGK